MKKNTLAKTIGFTTAAAVLTISICGCSVVKKLHSDIDTAVESVAQNGGTVDYYGVEGRYDIATPVFASEGAATTEVVAESGTEEGSGYSDAGVSEKQLEEYAEHGLTYNIINGQWWLGEKPVAVLRDRGTFTMTNGLYVDIGALALVERDSNDNITSITDVSRETMEEETGMTITGNNEQTARQDGYRFYLEDVNVKDMDSKQLGDLDATLHAKYRNQKAIVQCNDYVFCLEKGDMLNLSSHCATSYSPFGVKIYADYAVADETDITAFDSIVIDNLLFDLLKSNTFENAQQVEAAAKEAVAEHYGISTKNLAALASLL
ncbi:hypothetical protein LJC56_09620 [Christensenellaceae bacterium OttesenSCG-928-K19]|nr:hypothetical protein [Christensenellaceae bacterium OttesenSCG-928-K19]